MRSLVAVLMIMGCAIAARAERIDFEAPDYIAPSTLPSGWSANSALITTDQATSGSQSLALGLHIWGGYNYSNASVDRSIGLDTDPAGQATFIMDIMPSSASRYGSYGTVYVGDQHSSTLSFLYFGDYDGDNNLDITCRAIYHPDQQLGTFTPGQWYRYRLTIDWAGSAITHRVETLDGQLVGAHTEPTTAADAGYMASGIGYLSLIGSGLADAPVYFDQLLINEVPEPATMALLGVGLIGLIRRR